MGSSTFEFENILYKVLNENPTPKPLFIKLYGIW